MWLLQNSFLLVLAHLFVTFLIHISVCFICFSKLIGREQFYIMCKELLPFFFLPKICGSSKCNFTIMRFCCCCVTWVVGKTSIAFSCQWNVLTLAFCLEDLLGALIVWSSADDCTLHMFICKWLVGLMQIMYSSFKILFKFTNYGVGYWIPLQHAGI